jgi:hypothetical protein
LRQLLQHDAVILLDIVMQAWTVSVLPLVRQRDAAAHADYLFDALAAATSTSGKDTI